MMTGLLIAAGYVVLIATLGWAGVAAAAIHLALLAVCARWL